MFQKKKNSCLIHSHSIVEQFDNHGFSISGEFKHSFNLNENENRSF